jgi:hypothetical protein
MKLASACAFIGLLLAWYLCVRPSVPQPKLSRGAHAFWAVQRSLIDGLGSDGINLVPYDDKRSGWEQLGSNQWRVHGLIEYTNKTVPWTAIFRDRGKRGDILYLRIGDTVVREYANWPEKVDDQ